MLTDRQRHKLANEARKLAMECVEGTAPKFGYPWPTCACGTAGDRAGIGWKKLSNESYDGTPIGDAIFLVSDANCELLLAGQDPRPYVVFPLLALADALDELRAAPSPTPNTRKER